MTDILRSMGSAIKNLITRGKVIASQLTAGRTVLTCSALADEQFQYVELVQPYGFSALPTAGDVVLLANMAARNGLIAIHADDPLLRIEDLQPGEFGFRDQSGSQIVFRQDRIEVSTPLKVVVSSLDDIDVTTSANLNATVTGTATVNVTGNTVVNTVGNTTVTTAGNTAITTAGITNITSGADCTVTSATKTTVSAPHVYVHAGSTAGSFYEWDVAGYGQRLTYIGGTTWQYTNYTNGSTLLPAITTSIAPPGPP